MRKRLGQFVEKFISISMMGSLAYLCGTLAWACPGRFFRPLFGVAAVCASLCVIQEAVSE